MTDRTAARIVIVGDSQATDIGLDDGERDLGQVLGDLLATDVVVLNESRAAAPLADTLRRLPDLLAVPVEGLVIVHGGWEALIALGPGAQAGGAGPAQQRRLRRGAKRILSRSYSTWPRATARVLSLAGRGAKEDPREFERQLEQAVSLICERSSAWVLIVPPSAGWMGEYIWDPDVMSQNAAACRRVVMRHNQRARTVFSDPRREAFGRDGVHFNAEGHARLARSLASAICPIESEARG